MIFLTILQIVEIIQQDSVVALSGLQDKYLDWIYLDTCHDYSVPHAELQIAKSKVKSGGVICGHDYTSRAHSDGTNME